MAPSLASRHRRDRRSPRTRLGRAWCSPSWLPQGLVLSAVALLAAGRGWVSCFVPGRPWRAWAWAPRFPGPQGRGVPLRADTKLYDILGVDSFCSVKALKKAYYREAKTCHPDAHPDDDAAYNRFQEVAEAYRTLADPVSRQQYDLSGLAGLASLKVNASRIFGPPPWRVLVGRTNHYMWHGNSTGKGKQFFLGLAAESIPNGILGVTMETLAVSWEKAKEERIAILLPRCSQQQAEDTVDAVSEFGIAVKAEPIEGQNSKETETPIQGYQVAQMNLDNALTSLRESAFEVETGEASTDDEDNFNKWLDLVKELRSELRIAKLYWEESKKEKQELDKKQDLEVTY